MVRHLTGTVQRAENRIRLVHASVRRAGTAVSAGTQSEPSPSSVAVTPDISSLERLAQEHPSDESYQSSWLSRFVMNPWPAANAFPKIAVCSSRQFSKSVMFASGSQELGSEIQRHTIAIHSRGGTKRSTKWSIASSWGAGSSWLFGAFSTLFPVSCSG